MPQEEIPVPEFSLQFQERYFNTKSVVDFVKNLGQEWYLTLKKLIS
jgi:hypothetical protein